MPVPTHLKKRGEELRSHPRIRYEKTSESGYRTGILLAHAGNNVAWAMGILNYLDQVHLTSAVDVMVTVNPAMGFFQSKQTSRGRKIICDDIGAYEVIENGLLRKKVNIDKLDALFRSEDGLDVEAVRKNPCPLYVGVTGIDGHGELIDAKAPGVDLIDALIATITLPTKDFAPKFIGGSQWVTGSLAMPLPVVETVEKFKLTDLLVILNDPIIPTAKASKKRSAGFIERNLASFFIRPFSSGLLKAFLHRKEVYRESLAQAVSGTIGECRVLVLARKPEDRTSKLCTDPRVLNPLFLFGHKAVRVAFNDSAD
jgi:hypothetical protein